MEMQSFSPSSSKPNQQDLYADERDFVITLDEWVAKYCLSDQLSVEHKKEVFDDGQTLRYKVNWMPVEEFHLNPRAELVATGCLNIHVNLVLPHNNNTGRSDPKEMLNHKSTGTTNPLASLHTGLNVSGEITVDGQIPQDRVIPQQHSRLVLSTHTTPVSMLVNYRTLWRHFQEDPDDEVARYAPLFRSTVALVFHPITIRLMVAMTVYETLVYLGVFIIFPSRKSVYATLVITSSMVYLFLYLSLFQLYRSNGFLPGHENHRKKDNSNTSRNNNAHHHSVENVPTRRLNETRLYRISWLVTLRQVVRGVMKELSELWSMLRCGCFKEVDVKRSHIQHTTHNLDHTGGINNKRSYRQTERMTPWQYNTTADGISYYELLNIAMKFLTKHNTQRGGRSQLLLHRRLHNLKLLFILVFLPIYLALSYYAPPGTPLRTMLKTCRQQGLHSNPCNQLLWPFILSGGYFLHFFFRYILAATLCLSLIGLAFGCEVAHSLINSWIFRFGALRGITMDCCGDNKDSVLTSSYSGKFADKEAPNDMDVESNTTSLGQSTRFDSMDAQAMSRKASFLIQQVVSPLGNGLSYAQEETRRHSSMANSGSSKNTSTARNTSSSSGVSNSSSGGGSNSNTSNESCIDKQICLSSCADLVPLILRDSYEHYLFLRDYMAMASRKWSPVLLSLYCCFCHWCGGGGGGGGGGDYGCGVLSNAPMESVRTVRLTGGREAWLEYIEKVPAIWTVYGLWITWDRLTGLLWTAVTLVGVVAVSQLAGTNLAE